MYEYLFNKFVCYFNQPPFTLLRMSNTNGDSDHDVIVLKYCHWFLSYYAKNSTVVGVTIFTDSHFVISGDGKQDPSCV
jgi:hypothetical protein